MILSLALGQDTEHDPEAMAFCSGLIHIVWCITNMKLIVSNFFYFKAKQTDFMTIQMIAIHTSIAGMMAMLAIKEPVQMDSSGIIEF